MSIYIYIYREREREKLTEYSKSDEFIKQESQRCNVSVSIYHHQDFKSDIKC